MKTRSLLSITFVFWGFFLFAAKKPDAKSVYLQQLSSTPTIETLNDFTSVENDKVFIRMFHNEQNIKVQIVVPDKSMQAKFLMQGLQLFFDISGKKSKKYCVSFPKVDREQMQGGVQMQREPGQQRPDRQAGGQMQMNLDLKPIIEEVGLNSSILINGRNETLLDIGRVYMKPFGEEDHLLYNIEISLSALGGKVGKDALVSIGLLAEMELSNTGGGMGPGGGMGGARMRPDGGDAGNAGNQGNRPSGGSMRPGGSGGGALFTEMATPFNAWISFGLN